MEIRNLEARMDERFKAIEENIREIKTDLRQVFKPVR
jgi:hypothetical protein